MVNRVYLSNDVFRVSKPGWDAVTTTDPQNLLFDMNYLAVGTYVTGQINPLSSGYVNTGGYGGGPYCTIPFTQPFSNTLPMAFVQQQNGSGGAIGATYNDDTTVTREFVDTSPPSYIYHTDETSTILVPETTINSIRVTVSASNQTIRYHVFYVPTTTQVYPSQNLNAAAMSWSNNFTPNANAWTNAPTVSGMDSGAAAVFQITSSLGYVSTCISHCLITRTSQGLTQNLDYQLQPGQNTMFVQVYDGDQITLGLMSTDSVNRTTTFTVTNTSANNTTIGTASVSCNYVQNTPNPAPNWNSVSGTNSGSTNSVTIQGINVAVTLQLNFSTPYSGVLGGTGSNPTNLTNASSFQFTVFNGTAYAFSFAPTATYNGSVTVVDVNTGAIIDTFSVSIAVGTNTINVVWSNINGRASSGKPGGTSTAVGDTNTVTIPNNLFTNPHNWTVSVPGGVSLGGLTAFVSGTAYAIGSATSFNVYGGQTVYFEGTLHGANADASYTVTVFDNTTGTTINSFSVSLSVSNTS